LPIGIGFAIFSAVEGEKALVQTLKPANGDRTRSA
jgi:hypothetical protein